METKRRAGAIGGLEVAGWVAGITLAVNGAAPDPLQIVGLSAPSFPDPERQAPERHIRAPVVAAITSYSMRAETGWYSLDGSATDLRRG
jgi:hypothetical protein